MNYTYIKYFISAVVSALFCSCSYEDINSIPVDLMSDEVIYGDSVKIAGFVNNIYANVPSGYNRLGGNSMLAASTDEAVHAVRGSSAEKWGIGSWGPTFLPDNPFSSSYTAIRKTFVYEEKIMPNIKSEIMSGYGQDIFYGQVLFLRALYNFELLKRFGGYPLIKQLLSADQDLDMPRNSYEECVQYISDLCDEAAELLPLRYADAQFGRATKGAALALKSRLLLYNASPLFNNPSNPTGGIERGNYSANKWEAAVEAAYEVIRLRDNGVVVYSLFPNYANFFITLANNNEIILSKVSGPTNTLERLNGPVSITGGEGGTNPTLELVDAYEMIDGTKFDWENVSHANNPFANRDPRFSQSILHNGSIWMNNMIIETFENGKDKIGNRATRTSFYLKKFLSANARWNAPVGTAHHSFPLFRFGEILLNYAEALNEVHGPDFAPAAYDGFTARQAITQLRSRAGLTGNVSLIQNVPVGDVDRMREAIHHERQIELAFEEHRHLDLRRWLKAEEVLNRPVNGLQIMRTSTPNSFVYRKVEIENRVFVKHMYLYPFPQSEIGRNSGLVQNTGW